MLEVIIGTLIFIFLFQAVAGPVLVRFTQWAQKHPSIEALDPEAVPPGVKEKIQVYSNGLETIGFQIVGFYSMSDFIPNVHGTFAILMKADSKTWAMIPVLTCNKIETCYVEFCTEFSDDTEICTNNSDQLQAFIKNPGKKIFQFPTVADVGILYKLHDYLRYKHFKNRTVVLNGVGNERLHLQSSLGKDFMKQSALGYYYLDEDEDKFRPTWKGAILMTWKLMFPMGQIQKFFIRRQSKHIIEEVGGLLRNQLRF